MISDSDNIVISDSDSIVISDSDNSFTNPPKQYDNSDIDLISETSFSNESSSVLPEEGSIMTDPILQFDELPDIPEPRRSVRQRSVNLQETIRHPTIHHPVNNCCSPFVTAPNETFPLHGQDFWDIKDFNKAKAKFVPAKWYAGGLPRCRTCKITIRIGTLCLRGDISEIWTIKLNSFNIRVSPFRFCSNRLCFISKPKDRDDFTNFSIPTSVSLEHVSQANKDIIQLLLSDTSILLT